MRAVNGAGDWNRCHQWGAGGEQEENRTLPMVNPYTRTLEQNPTRGEPQYPDPGGLPLGFPMLWSGPRSSQDYHWGFSASTRAWLVALKDNVMLNIEPPFWFV